MRHQILKLGFNEEASHREKATSKQDLPKSRFRRWIGKLGKRFEQEYRDRRKHHVFWKGNRRNKREFTLTEFMYDVSVCEIGFVDSAVQGKELPYIRRAIWQVESEFARDSRQALIDFSKLVAGSGENKLFIAPIVGDPKAYRRVLLEPARHCSGDVYLAMVPHPDSWGKASADKIGLLGIEPLIHLEPLVSLKERADYAERKLQLLGTTSLSLIAIKRIKFYAMSCVNEDDLNWHRRKMPLETFDIVYQMLPIGYSG